MFSVPRSKWPGSYLRLSVDIEFNYTLDFNVTYLQLNNLLVFQWNNLLNTNDYETVGWDKETILNSLPKKDKDLLESLFTNRQEELWKLPNEDREMLFRIMSGEYLDPKYGTMDPITSINKILKLVRKVSEK